jgi:hypothetical protein
MLCIVVTRLNQQCKHTSKDSSIIRNLFDSSKIYLASLGGWLLLTLTLIHCWWLRTGYNHLLLRKPTVTFPPQK